MSTVAGRNNVSLDSICTCKICDHGLARDCACADCGCCSASNHSMVMDGIEGFLPAKREARQDEQ